MGLWGAPEGSGGEGREMGGAICRGGGAWYLGASLRGPMLLSGLQQRPEV